MTMGASITSGQKKQIERICQDAGGAAIKAINLDSGGAQRVIGRGSELRSKIIDIIRDLAGARFANEICSSYTYPKEYKGPRPVEEQVRALAKLFNLDPSRALDFAKNLLQLPGGAEGWFAIPTVDAVAAKHFPEVTDLAERYCQAVQLVHAKIAESRYFCSYREGQIVPGYLRVHARTAHALDLIAETQEGEIQIVAAQLGMRHRGRSVRRAREVFLPNEFGLGAFACGVIILTHPERFSTGGELWIDCAGDEVSGEADGSFESAPYFAFYDDRVRFSTVWLGSASEFFGSASGFFPQ
jgi:hypothetical protein